MSDKHYVGGDITSFSDNGKYKPISRVTLLVDDENSLTAGDNTGMEVIASCPHATQPMVNALLQAMKGYQYQAYEAGAANIDPAAELGDGVTVGGIYSALSKLSDDGRGYAGISSPGEAEMEDEYPSEGYITQEFNRKIAETRSTITKTSEEINFKVEGIDGRVSDITQTVDGISLSVTSASSPDGQTTATITLKVGPNNYTGYIKLDGNVDVSGQLSADALYSALGEIADLSVNRLSTSRRVVKYLAGDNNGKQRGYLVKRQNSLELTYETSTGKQLGLAARDEGYMDLMGMRKTVGLNFSGWDKGSWGVLLEGVTEMLNYGVTLNSAGVPIKITYPDGTDCPILW